MAKTDGRTKWKLETEESGYVIVTENAIFMSGTHSVDIRPRFPCEAIGWIHRDFINTVPIHDVPIRQEFEMYIRCSARNLLS